MLTLSQAHLSLLDACPREFQYRILDRLSGPIDPNQQMRLAWGELLHRLMEQASLGLDLEPLLEAHGEFRAPLDRLRRALGAHFDGKPTVPDAGSLPSSHYFSEHPRQLRLGDFGLLAVYDGLLLTADHAEIWDWKSYAKPGRTDRLVNHWQTRLYRYLLVETSDYRPEQVVMTYWFAGESTDRGPTDREPNYLRIAYDDRAHQQTHGDLLARCTQLAQWLLDYGVSPTGYEAGSQASNPDRQGQIRGFAQVADRSRCRDCAFAARCGRGAVPELDWQSLPEIAP